MPPTPASTLAPLVGVRYEDQYTVQTSLSVLKANLPSFYFTPHLAIITDGKAVGEAIRMTGPTLVYVRFPINDTGRPVSFSLPKQFLIPLTVRPLVVKPTTSIGTSLLASSYSSPAPTAIGGSSLAGGIGGSSFANHAHVELGLRLGEAGEPALCVVCGRWDEDAGKKRRSGHKCKGCIGQKSLERLRKEFERLSTSADDAEGWMDELIADPTQSPCPASQASPTFPAPPMSGSSPAVATAPTPPFTSGSVGAAAAATSPPVAAAASPPQQEDDVLET